MINTKLIIKLCKEGRIKKISDRMYDVDKHNVFFQTKSGRRLLLCDCLNHTKFCNESFCFHKEAVIGFQMIELFLKNINNKVERITGLKYSKEENKIDLILGELKDLQELRWK